ncbi:hypothetical protein RchiOBHm_Chr2g0112851 [Rosa chinensis]|uniref:Uncharacterized protein n=1 Tax=Rosa chinensis TaxID=74649 RepID=A0A2P6RQA7_ROSCH|nr:hypothetical protein RchiOBHm_Chr2g0112851 [Rosa chinensis]
MSTSLVPMRHFCQGFIPIGEFLPHFFPRLVFLSFVVVSCHCSRRPLHSFC